MRDALKQVISALLEAWGNVFTYPIMKVRWEDAILGTQLP